MKNHLIVKKVAVLGFGLEGKDLVRFLLRSKSTITVYDEKEREEIDFSGIDLKKVEIKWGKASFAGNLTKFDIIYRSPGVYRYRPEIVKAEKAGVKVSSAVKLFFDLCPARIIGVTGTKGKGTTSTLIYQILKKSGKDVYLAGNIGRPYLELLPKLKKSSWVVLELSSFQLIDLSKSPDVAIVLNITVDHLDWHKDRKEYVAAKRNIVRYQTRSDFAVINNEYSTPRSFSTATKARVISFSKKTLDKKYKKDILLRGEHNLENIAAAVAVAKVSGVGDRITLPVLSSFKGLEHRLELVRKVGGVSFYNDSFATGPQATIAAIKSFTEPLGVILGGSDKGLDYHELGKEVASLANIKNVILIGQVAAIIKRSLKLAGYKGRVINMDREGIEKIVQTAYSMTPKGGVVLLSPAAASFDMFKDYKERGNKFKEVVLKLI